MKVNAVIINDDGFIVGNIEIGGICPDHARVVSAFDGIGNVIAVKRYRVSDSPTHIMMGKNQPVLNKIMDVFTFNDVKDGKVVIK